MLLGLVDAAEVLQQKMAVAVFEQVFAIVFHLDGHQTEEGVAIIKLCAQDGANALAGVFDGVGMGVVVQQTAEEALVDGLLQLVVLAGVTLGQLAELLGKRQGRELVGQLVRQGQNGGLAGKPDVPQHGRGDRGDRKRDAQRDEQTLPGRQRLRADDEHGADAEQQRDHERTYRQKITIDIVHSCASFLCSGIAADAGQSHKHNYFTFGGVAQAILFPALFARFFASPAMRKKWKMLYAEKRIFWRKV